MMSKLVVMGIDPGYRTGYCIYDGDNIHKITTVPKDKMFDVLKQVKEDSFVTVIGVEKSSKTHIYNRDGASNRAMLRIAQNVGANKAEAERIIGMAMGLGFEVEVVEPKNTKVDPLLFKKITGYNKRTSSHARDAYGIASRVYSELFFKYKLMEAR